MKGCHPFNPLCASFVALFLLAGCTVTIVGHSPDNTPGYVEDADIEDGGGMPAGTLPGYVTAVFAPKDLGRAPTEDELDAARAVLEARLDAQNILDRRVSVDKPNGRITVRFPWRPDETGFDPGMAIEKLGSMAHLTFRDPDGSVVLEGSQVASASPAMDLNVVPVNYYVKLELKPDGAQAFAEATTRLIGQTISIYMDESEISAPTVQSAITDGSCVITGLESFAYAKTLASQINSGSLPFALAAEEWRVG